MISSAEDDSYKICEALVSDGLGSGVSGFGIVVCGRVRVLMSFQIDLFAPSRRKIGGERPSSLHARSSSFPLHGRQTGQSEDCVLA